MGKYLEAKHLKLTKEGFFDRNKYHFLAFFMPFLFLLVAFTIEGCSPFGDRQILVTDLWHQYYPFLVDFQDKLQSGGSLLHTWSIGLGVNYPALISYYLASPLNLLSVIVPNSFLVEFLTLCVCIRIGFAGFSFSFFLRKTFQKNDISLVLFSGLFSFCAFFMGYYWNVIWLDTVAILPLVMAGFLALQQEGKYRLYIISLALAVLTNYYIGFFVCIFVLLSFICYSICYCKTIKGVFVNLIRTAWTSVVALCMTTILTIPALLSLQNAYSSSSEFPKRYSINMGASNDLEGTLDAIRKVISNSIAFIEPTSKSGLPNIYCGMIALFLAFLFLFSRKIKLKEKIVSVSLLVFFILSFVIRQLDYIWHGFHFTNMIPYRFSFLFSFVVLVMAYRAYMLIDSFMSYDVLLATILSGMVIALSIHIKPTTAIIVSSVIVVMICLTLLLFSMRKIDKPYTSRVLFLIIIGEIISSMVFGVGTVSTSTKNDYPRGEEDTSSVIEYMDNMEADTVDLWRSEFTSTQTLNDGALNRTRGVSLFSSTTNVSLTKFLNEIGIAGWESGNRYCYYESSPVTNLLLNLKYIISRDGQYGNKDYLQKVYNSNEVYLLKNTAYLPLGFMVDRQALNYTVGSYENNPIAAQNELFKLLTGLDEDVYKSLEVVTQGHSDSSVLTVNKHQEGVYTIRANDSTAETHLKFNYTAEQDGMYCFYMTVNGVDNMTLKKNDEDVDTYYIKRGYLGCMSGFESGDKISFYATLGKNASGTVNVRCAYFDSEVFERGLEILSQSVMTAQKVTDTTIEGVIDVANDGLFYTSIAYEDGWKAYVDGKEVEITPLGDALVAFNLSQGTHTIKLVYMPSGFILGVMISVIGLAILIACIWYENKTKRQLMPALADIRPIIRDDEEFTEELPEVTSEFEQEITQDSPTEVESEDNNISEDIDNSQNQEQSQENFEDETLIQNEENDNILGE